MISFHKERNIEVIKNGEIIGIIPPEGLWRGIYKPRIPTDMNGSELRQLADKCDEVAAP